MVCEARATQHKMHHAEATCAPRSNLQFTTCLLFTKLFIVSRACALIVRPALPRPGESLDEGGHCVVVVVVAITFLLPVPVHGGGIQHERGAASAKNGQKSLTYLGGWAELRGGI